jgi:hypothetical protein
MTMTYEKPVPHGQAFSARVVMATPSPQIGLGRFSFSAVADATLPDRQKVGGSPSTGNRQIDVRPTRQASQNQAPVAPLSAREESLIKLCPATGQINEGNIGTRRLRGKINEYRHEATANTRPGDVVTSFFKSALRSFKCVQVEITSMADHFNRWITPALNELAKRFEGKVFKKTASTPRAILRASVPKGKENKDLSFSTLANEIRALPLKASPLRPQLVLEGNQILLCRTKNGITETLELAFRRPGKVDLYLNGSPKSMGNLWNDDALLAAKAFLSGKNFSLSKREPSAWVVKSNIGAKPTRSAN